MIPREWIEIFRVLHGTYNSLIGLALIYQGWLGMGIRKKRKAGGPEDFRIVRRHRVNGPILALLGILGYAAGAVLIVIDKGHLLEYPLHHLMGISIIVLLATTFLVSRKIRHTASRWRTAHFMLGLAILVAYLVQLFLGLNILL
jgi:hypothetical protein